ncbi:TetR/AcrR family transcriptional regulator [Actinomyces wuliandei]|uniref:TetR/AcrR family transcriptional regulator n=1 Tax=Actinomyces wuliandei TaxID=2057743 RepID=UPI000FD8E9D4|nr:TetR family transcriptional regulator [Actinomyces wuliandei]
MSPRTDLRPRRRMDPQERRDLILAAAAQAFAAQPYDDVSVTSIAHQVEASEALVHKYFTSKARLYAEVVSQAVQEIAAQIIQADKALPTGSSARDRVRTSILTYLDFIIERTPGWTTYQLLAGHEPGPATEVRQQAREQAVTALAEVVGGSHGPRDDFAFHGYLSFLDTACLRWAQAGCPPEERYPLVEAALGCLEGALGDWRA